MKVIANPLGPLFDQAGVTPVVYVDPLLPCLPNANWKWNKSCHLFCEDRRYLHAFAETIGLKTANSD